MGRGPDPQSMVSEALQPPASGAWSCPLHGKPLRWPVAVFGPQGGLDPARAGPGL